MRKNDRIGIKITPYPHSTSVQDPVIPEYEVCRASPDSLDRGAIRLEFPDVFDVVVFTNLRDFRKIRFQIVVERNRRGTTAPSNRVVSEHGKLHVPQN